MKGALYNPLDRTLYIIPTSEKVIELRDLNITIRKDKEC